jgi:hypothetical protein
MIEVTVPLRKLLSRVKIVKHLHAWLTQKSRAYLRWTNWTSPGRELASILRLVHRKGLRWTWHTEAALKFADDRLPFTPFSLKPSAFRALSSIISLSTKNILELGSGNSTLALWYLLSKIGPNEFHLVTFEDNPDYYAQQSIWVQQCKGVTAVYAPLKRLSESDEFIWQHSEDKLESYNQLGVTESLDQDRSRGTDRMFYDYDFRNLADRAFDLVILDGPLVPTRWYAYLLLASLCPYPFILLIDDFPLYPELNQIERYFDVQLLDRGEYYEYGYVLYKVNSIRPS